MKRLGELVVLEAVDVPGIERGRRVLVTERAASQMLSGRRGRRPWARRRGADSSAPRIRLLR